MATKKKNAKQPAKKAKPAAQKPAKKAAKKAATKPAKKAAAKPTKKPVKQTAKKSAKTGAKKASAPKSSQKTAAKPARSATKKPAKKAAKQAAKQAAKKAAPKAAASTSKATATLVQHVFIKGTPAEVYQALTDPAAHGAFTGTVATGEPIVGGTYTASSGYIHGTFEKLEQNKLIVQTWTTTEWPANTAPSRLEISLEDAGDGTELTMTHSEVPAGQAEAYRQGWIDYYWNPLRAHFGKAA